MAKKKSTAEEPSKQFNDTFRTLADRYFRLDVWRDFVISFACLISISMTPDHFNERKQRYEKIRKKYTEQELASLDALYQITCETIEKNPDQDFLGETYMSLNFGSKERGQFFTPYHISKMMAKLTYGGDEEIKEKGFVSVCDPCCGAGGLLVAFANELRLKYDNIGPIAFFAAQDIDYTVALMCYIQLSLIGCAGYVAVGDSLTHPVPDMTSETTWITPMCYSKIWQDRFEEKYEETKRREKKAA